MIIKKDGFQFFAATEKHPECIIIGEVRLENACKYIRIHKTQGIAFAGKCTQNNLNFIEEFSWITTFLILTDDKVKDLSVLNRLPKLLSVWGKFDVPLNLDNSHLQYLACDWSKKGFISKECINLRHILITGCKDFPSFWEQLSALTKLEKVHFVRGNITDCTDIKKMHCLEHLELSYLPKLVSLDGIGVLKETLKTLFLHTGKNIIDYTPLSELENLEILAIRNKSIITDLSFLKPLKKLQSFRVVETKIKATNLEFLDTLPQLLFYRTGVDKYSN